MEERILELVKKFSGTAGIVIREATGSFMFCHNEQMLFPSASIIKLYILWALYLKIDQIDIDRSTLWTLSEIDKIPGYGILKDIGAGSTFSVRDLAMLMITLSDNIATNTLIDMIGVGNINKAIRETPAIKTILQRKMMDLEAIEKKRDNFTTPKDTIEILSYYLESDRLPYELRSEMMAFLKKQIYNNLLSQYMPSGFVFAHKTGDMPNVLHDAGILYTPNNRSVLIAVLTRDFERVIDSVFFHNEIGKVIFEHFANNN